jgi:hypothetical protein
MRVFRCCRSSAGPLLQPPSHVVPPAPSKPSPHGVTNRHIKPCNIEPIIRCSTGSIRVAGSSVPAGALVGGAIVCVCGTTFSELSRLEAHLAQTNCGRPDTQPTVLPRLGAVRVCSCGTIAVDSAGMADHVGRTGCDVGADAHLASTPASADVPTRVTKRGRFEDGVLAMNGMDALAVAAATVSSRSIDVKQPSVRPDGLDSTRSSGGCTREVSGFTKPEDLVGCRIRIAWSLGHDLRTRAGQNESEIVRVVGRVGDTQDTFRLECILLDARCCRMAEDNRAP